MAAWWGGSWVAGFRACMDPKPYELLAKSV